jgi:hypothetical protein
VTHKASDEVPHPPYHQLKTALGNDLAACDHVDQLQEQLVGPHPNPRTIAATVSTLSRIKTIEAVILNWWDSPTTQEWIAALSDAGL